MTRAALRRAAAPAGYLALALAYAWPLPRLFSTHFPGTAMESFNNIWNLWHFRHAVAVLKDNPLWTDMQYWPYGANLLLVHYTLVNDAIAYFLAPALGLAACYNLLFVASLVLSGWGTFLLLADFGVGAAAAFAAGAAYAFSPAMTLQVMTGRGLDYTSFHTLPFLAWFLFRTLRDGRLRDAVLAALFLSLTWLYNYYYFLSGLLLVPIAYLAWHRPLKVAWEARRETSFIGWAKVAAAAALGLALAAVLRSAALGQKEWHGSGGIREILRYMSPYLAFWGLLGLHLGLRWKPRVKVEAKALGWTAWGPPFAVLACWAAMNAPLILGLARLMASGDYGAPQNRWRGGGNPVDIAWMLLPGYWQPLWTGFLSRRFGPAHYSSFGLLVLLALAWLWRRGPGERAASAWWGCFAAFFVLMLGPWLKAFGTHLYLPLPFYLLHALPVFINMPNGIYFNAIASLFAALLLGAALKAGQARLGKPWAAALPWAVLLALGFESWHGGLKTFVPEFPGLIHRLKDRPAGVLLPIPVSANFHIIVNPGPVGDHFMELELAQTVHEKPFIGGHLGRVARRVHGYMSADPVFQGLLSAQGGGEVSRLLKDPRLVSRYLRDMKVRYLLVESSRLPPALLKAVEGWPARLADREGTLRLYEVSPEGRRGARR